MTFQRPPEIIVDRINYERLRDYYAAITESLDELFIAGFLPKAELSIEQLGGWENWIQRINKEWENDEAYVFQVVEKTTDQIVGGVFLNRVVRSYQMANLGYWIRTSRVGEGFATEAAKQAARYGFEHLGFQRIEIVVSKDNLSSIKIAEKVGAVREGLLRNRLNLQGLPCDAYMYSLIPTDYGIRKSA